jgi:excisionase family DNA binding protein
MNHDHEDPDLFRDGLERVADAARFLGVSKSFIYMLIQAGTLPSVKLGTSRRVPVRAVRDLARTNLVLIPVVPGSEPQK